MHRMMHPDRSQRPVVAPDQANLDRAFAISIVRRTSVAGLIGLVYGICTGVILAAYHEFGSPFLLKSRFVAADPPAQVLPEKPMLDDTAEAPGPARQEASVTALAAAVPLTSPTGSPI